MHNLRPELAYEKKKINVLEGGECPAPKLWNKGFPAQSVEDIGPSMIKGSDIIHKGKRVHQTHSLGWYGGS